MTILFREIIHNVSQSRAALRNFSSKNGNIQFNNTWHVQLCAFVYIMERAGLILEPSTPPAFLAHFQYLHTISCQKNATLAGIIFLT